MPSGPAGRLSCLTDVASTRARLEAIAQERGERLVITKPSTDGDGVLAALETIKDVPDDGPPVRASAKGRDQSGQALSSLLHLMARALPLRNPALIELSDLEHVLREQAFLLNAQLVVRTMPDGKIRAAFVDQFAQRVTRPGMILLAAEAPDRRAALGALHSLAIG